MKRTAPAQRFTILGIAPSRNGFGFAVMEPQGFLFSWGIARLYSKNPDEFIQRLGAMIKQYRVRLVCVDEVTKQGRSERARTMIAGVGTLAAEYGLLFQSVSRDEVRTVLGLDNSAPKYEIARRLTEVFSELTTHLPPPRKIWMAEPERMKVFEAVSIATAQRSRTVEGRHSQACWPLHGPTQ